MSAALQPMTHLTADHLASITILSVDAHDSTVELRVCDQWASSADLREAAAFLLGVAAQLDSI